ncbi:hypothetical protein AVEN_260547-1 [Araneus ventricosus]|uniref:Uncharacterized protein n=1 Tax=Araneus ventricosus TaxID=182803 RepID=A0A4Y2I2B0_ARAVE|nr:hypothetical protein AVEN_260547-1 [Araneus ventricosus]
MFPDSKSEILDIHIGNGIGIDNGATARRTPISRRYFTISPHSCYDILCAAEHSKDIVWNIVEHLVLIEMCLEILFEKKDGESLISSHFLTQSITN